MKTKNIISNSVASFVGSVFEHKNILRDLEYFKYNQNWLSNFDNIILSLNGDRDLCNDLIENLFPFYPKTKFTLLYSENIGPVFGAMDNDRKIFEYCINQKYEYIWKFSMDVIADDSILEVDINDEDDFFYINNIGYAAFDNATKDELLKNILDHTYFYPQTNYYIVKNKIKKWYPNIKEIIDLQNRYEELKKDHPNEQYQPWDAIQGCDCEYMLSKTIRDNDLRISNLLSVEDNKKIIDLVFDHKIIDGSHKNILYTNVGNLCHFHYIGHPVAPV